MTDAYSEAVKKYTEPGQIFEFKEVGEEAKNLSVSEIIKIISEEKLIITNELFQNNYLKLSIGKKRHINPNTCLSQPLIRIHILLLKRVQHLLQFSNYVFLLNN